MSYFLSNQTIKIGEPITLDGEEGLHIIKARRIKIGEYIVVQGPDYKRFRCEVVNIDKSRITLRPMGEVPTPPEPQLQITVCQALVAEQALDIIIQKLTELGAGRLIIFESEHSPASIKQKIDSKRARWNRISLEAAKQSGRAKSIAIEYKPTLTDALNQLENMPIIFLDPLASTHIRSIEKPTNDSIAIVIGPEGGLSESETNLLKESKTVTSISLGPRILRAETAGLAITAILQSRFGDLQ